MIPVTYTSEHRPVWKNPYFYLLFSAIAVFVGRAIQLLIWDAPFRVLLWDESLMSPVLSVFGISWGEYLKHPFVNSLVEFSQIVLSCWFLLAAIIAANLKRWSDKWIVWFIYWSAVAFLALFILLLFKDRHYQFGKLIEYSLQVASPMFLWFYIREKTISGSLFLAMVLATAMTFIGHGLYAYGHYPVPGHYQQMVMNILGTDNDATLQFLHIAGIIDFIVAFLILVPGYSRIAGLGYMAIWGFLTTLARLWANIPYDSFGYVMERWLFEFIYRFPHFLIPILLLLYYVKVRGSRQV